MPETTNRDDGLREKFVVKRVAESSRGTDHGACRYFVLDPLHDPIAEKALRIYADQARREGYAALANDLDQWLHDIQEAHR